MKISKEDIINKKHEKIIKIFKIHNGYARSKDILDKGIHPCNIKSVLDEGVIIKMKNYPIIIYKHSVCAGLYL